MLVYWIFWFIWLWFQPPALLWALFSRCFPLSTPVFIFCWCWDSVLFAAEAKHGASGPVQFCFVCTVHSLRSRREVFAVSSRFSSSVNKSYATWLPWRQQVVSVCADLLIAAIAFAPEAEFACNVPAHSLPTQSLSLSTGGLPTSYIYIYIPLKSLRSERLLMFF